MLGTDSDACLEDLGVSEFLTGAEAWESVQAGNDLDALMDQVAAACKRDDDRVLRLVYEQLKVPVQLRR